MLSVDEEPSGSMSLPVDDTECLMTPPKCSVSDTLLWTPTANLKLLLKAASPDLHSRDTLYSQSRSYKACHSNTSATVSDFTVANVCDIGMTADTHVAENVTVSVNKQRRKDKSLGLLCER